MSSSTPEPALAIEQVVKVLRTIQDPEIPVNIYDLGLIYDVGVSDDGRVDIKMTLTSPGCPVADMLVQQVQMRIEAIEAVSEATVELVWDPPWSRDRMSDAAKLTLNLDDDTPLHRPGNDLFQVNINRPR